MIKNIETYVECDAPNENSIWDFNLFNRKIRLQGQNEKEITILTTNLLLLTRLLLSKNNVTNKMDCEVFSLAMNRSTAIECENELKPSIIRGKDTRFLRVISVSF